MKKFYLKGAILAGFAFFTQNAVSQVTIAEDNASAYTTELWNTSNPIPMSGFTPWFMQINGDNENGVAGYSIGSSTEAGFGNVNTNDKAFYVYGYKQDTLNPDFEEAVVRRYFTNTGAPSVIDNRSHLMPGQVFSIDLAVARRNGFKGIDLITDGGARIWNFGMDGDRRYQVNDADIFGNQYMQQSVFEIKAYQLTASTFKVIITRGSQTWESETYSGQVGGFKIYIGQTISNLPLNRLYFNNLKVVQCPDETTWNGTAWSNGDPAIYKRVIINGDYTSTGSLSACTLTVADGAEVLIKKGHTLTVSSNIDVETGSALVIEHNSALVQVADNAVNNGNITVKRNSNALYRLDYTLWGAPVTNQELQGFSPNTFNTRFYTYAYNWQANATPEPTYNELYWQADPAASFTPGKGYLIRMPNIITPEEAEAQSETEGMPYVTAPAYNTVAAQNSQYIFQGAFTGIINNGQVNVPLTVPNLNPAQPGNLSQAGHYTAVSNPYASPISVADFFTQNSSVLAAGDGIYFWRKKNDADATSYSCLTMAGYIENEAGGSAGNNGVFYPSPATGAFNKDWIISPGQGFIVKIAADANVNNSIVFNNSMRKAAPALGNQPFFRTLSTNDASASSKFWLNLTNTNNKFSQTAVAYMPEATTGLDFALDGRYIGGGTVALYSVVNENKLSIQARPAFTDTDTVPLGFVAAIAGQHTISLNRTEGVFAASQDIYLKDNLTGAAVNLKEGDYTFSTDAGTFATRFEVVYNQSQLGTQNPERSNTVVYQSNGAIHIESGAVEINAVTVYDLQGRTLYTQTGINSTQATVNNLHAAHQVLVVEINTAKGKESKKIVY